MKVNRFWLIAGLIVTTVTALGIHAGMLGALHVPYPYGYPHKGWAVFPDAFASTVAAFYVALLLDDRFQKLSTARRCLLLFLLLATVKESLFRAAFMNIMNSSSILFPIVQALPRLISLAITAALVVLAASRLRREWSPWGAALAISVLVFFVCNPLIDALFKPLLASMAWMSGPSLYDPPYDYHILIPAYLSFLEPVIACFFMVALVWKNLPLPTLRRAGLFTLLTLGLKGPMIKPFIAPMFGRATFVMAFLSEAQFSFESIALGCLTALTWALATRFAGVSCAGRPGE